MSDINETRESVADVQYPAEVKAALNAVTELPEDLEEQADFYDKVQNALSTRLRDDQ
jgi:23S rRNA (cytidine1920-2'-O)/16S rRNA (cytidine1409-2'-O)-methyltransferase